MNKSRRSYVGSPHAFMRLKTDLGAWKSSKFLILNVFFGMGGALPPWRYKSHIHSSLDPCVFWSVKKTAFSQKKGSPDLLQAPKYPREFPDSTSNRKKTESRGRDDVMQFVDGFFGCWLVDDVLLKQNFLGLTCRKIVVTLNAICWWKKHVLAQQKCEPWQGFLGDPLWSRV